MTVKVIAIAALFLPLLLAQLTPAAEAALRKIVRGAFVIAVASTLPLFLVQLSVVILRSVFSVSFIWLQESVIYLFGTMFLLASGALLVSEGHVRVDILYAKLSEEKQRIVDLLGQLIFVMPLSVLIILVSWDYVATSWAQMERSQEASGIHAVFLLKSLIPAFAVLLLFAAQLQVLKLSRAMRGVDA